MTAESTSLKALASRHRDRWVHVTYATGSTSLIADDVRSRGREVEGVTVSVFRFLPLGQRDLALLQLPGGFFRTWECCLPASGSADGVCRQRAPTRFGRPTSEAGLWPGGSRRSPTKNAGRPRHSTSAAVSCCLRRTRRKRLASVQCRAEKEDRLQAVVRILCLKCSLGALDLNKPVVRRCFE